MRFSKSRTNNEVHSNASLPLETRKTLKIIIITLNLQVTKIRKR